MAGTHIRLGGGRISVQSGGSIRDAAELLEVMTRANVRAFRDDPTLREEAIRRVLSPPCATRCHVRPGVGGGPARHDCNCLSGMQYADDDDKEALEACPARDTWSDFRSLSLGHVAAGRGPQDPIVADCDCLTPLALAVGATIAWMQPAGGMKIGGTDLGSWRDPDARFAVAITHPNGAPIAHAYGLTSRKAPAPQPEIKIGGLYVWDPAAHWGMPRPPDAFYDPRETVAVEVRRDALDGLKF